MPALLFLFTQNFHFKAQKREVFFSKSIFIRSRDLPLKFGAFLCILEGVFGLLCGGSPMAHLGIGSHMALAWLSYGFPVACGSPGGGMALTWLS